MNDFELHFSLYIVVIIARILLSSSAAVYVSIQRNSFVVDTVFSFWYRVEWAKGFQSK